MCLERGAKARSRLYLVRPNTPKTQAYVLGGAAMQGVGASGRHALTGDCR